MKITDDVRAVLGTLAYPTTDRAVIAAQLDRAAYQKVNEALEALGGAWSRRDRAHVFHGKEARAVIAIALGAGQVTTAKDLGYFPTPPGLAARLVELAVLDPGDHVLEPSAGAGAIVEAILDSATDVDVVAVEVDEGRSGALLRLAARDSTDERLTVVQADFLAWARKPTVTGYEHVIMNPPFDKSGTEMAHVYAAYELLRPGGRLVSVLPQGILQRSDKKRASFRAWVDQLGGTIEELPEGSFTGSGTGVRTCVLVVERR